MSSVVPEGWSVYALGELGQVVGGGTPPSETLSYWGGSVMWATPAEITKLKSRYITKTLRTITKEGLQKSSAKLHPKGTILLTSRASIGYPAINSVPMATNQGFQSLRPNEKLDVEYGYQLILNNRNGLERLSAGSTFLEISSKEINKYKLPIPPLPEQKKIASILTSVDEVIENTQKQIDKLQDLKKATMNELLTKGIGHTEFKDSELGRIPKSWEVTSLGECFNLTSGKSKPKRLLSSVKTQLSKVPVYGGNGVTGYTDSELLDEQTIVIGRVGEYCGCVHLTPKLCWITDNALYIKSITRVFDLSFMFHLMVFSDLAQLQSKGGQPLVSQKPISEFVIALPSIVEQQKIASFIDGISSNIDNQSIKLTQTQSLKKSLMQDLLTGKVRVMVS